MQPDSGPPDDSSRYHESGVHDSGVHDSGSHDFGIDEFGRDDVREFTFFVDAEAYGLGGYDAAALAADESDLHEAGIVSVDIPTGFGGDLGDRIPVRVRASASGLRFYARLLGIRDPMQWDELERVCSATRRTPPQW